MTPYTSCSISFLSDKTDDPVDAVPVHAANGVWGLLCVGLFCSKHRIEAVYGRDDVGDYGLFMGVCCVWLIIYMLTTHAHCIQPHSCSHAHPHSYSHHTLTLNNHLHDILFICHTAHWWLLIREEGNSLLLKSLPSSFWHFGLQSHQQSFLGH